MGIFKIVNKLQNDFSKNLFYTVIMAFSWLMVKRFWRSQFWRRMINMRSRWE
ncbi:hypothetical protein [Cylindrospermopsis raciborskii]|uniref:hypothetical protein n=1 Tax=Cylindrospermopsis raciborskii TaxID=77022 RepID=UPI001454C3F7|nr:hypothetical protein [Cylindrospermopsis raciborskii]